jgi:hypothetical protein
VVGSGECSNEPSDSGTTEIGSWLVRAVHSIFTS